MTASAIQNTATSLPEDFHMNVNDFGKRMVIKPETYSWTYSPMTGAEQVTLDGIGGDRERATTIVRYAPNSELLSHVHEGGQEVFVLEGSFADEHGDYPAGAYIRIPRETSSTRKVGPKGTTLFIKSNQFAKDDTQNLVLDTHKTEWHQGLVDGLQVMPLHHHEVVHVALVRWAPHTQFKPHAHIGGEEILVLDGVFYDEHDRYPKGTWIRSPHLSHHTPFTKEEGALIYVKVGHLLPPTL